MNLRLLACIAIGVFVAHLGVFMLLAQFRPKPPRVLPLPPNFSAKSTTVIDEKTGVKTTYSEITVSTQFAPTPAPPPPVKPVPPEIVMPGEPAANRE